MSDYRQDDARFPWISEQVSYGKNFKFVMTNVRSENWYGKPGTSEANNAYLDLIKPGDYVMDCGANEGYTTVLAALKAGRSGRVLAFEPAPHNRQPIEINLAINGFNNVQVLQTAVGADHGVRAFAGERVVDAETTVPVMALDEFETFEPDVIKIDIEGFELKALRGAEQILRKSKPHIFLEAHLHGPTGVDMRDYGDDPEVLFGFLEILGYECFHDGNKVVALRDGVNIFKHPDRKDRRSLIYTIAYGEEAHKQAAIMVKSLRTFGEYEGDIHVYTDSTQEFEGATRTIYFEDVLAFPRPHIGKAFIGKSMFVESYDTVAFLDADIVAINPIHRLLKTDHLMVASEGEFDPAADDEWFSLPGSGSLGPRVAINSGTIVAPASQWNAICGIWWNAMLSNRRPWYSQRGVDQPTFNDLLHRQRIDGWKVLPPNAVHFMNNAAPPLSPDTMLVHPKGSPKVALMQLITQMRENHENIPR